MIDKMHDYSIDNGSRNTVVIIITIVSLGLYIVLGLFCSDLLLSWFNLDDKYECIQSDFLGKSIGLFLNCFSFSFFFGIIYALYNNFFWKLKPIRKIHKVPNLNGVWEGKLESSYAVGKEIDMKLTIKQKWAKISFTAEFNNTHSNSHSNMAAIHMNEAGFKKIYFGFTNQSYDVNFNIQRYDGYNILELVGEDDIKGIYFNNRGASREKGGNVGSFSLTRNRKTVKLDEPK